MVFPISDDNSDRETIPVVNYALIALNIFVFLVLQRFGTNDLFTYQFSTVPEEIRTGKEVRQDVELVDPATRQKMDVQVPPTPISVYLTLLTSMFLHANLVHIAGNLLFL